MSANGVTLTSQAGSTTHTTGANFQGDILVLDTNSWDGVYPAASNAYECAAICKSTSQVSAPRISGISGFRSDAKFR